MSSALKLDHHDAHSTDLYGFWLYILSDCILFATIFGTYAVLHNNVYGGAGIKEFTNIGNVFIETIVLLTSSLTCGFAAIALYKNKLKQGITWLSVTFLLGAFFVYMEINEFIQMYVEGHSWQNSAALSAFFTLVGTHGFHVFIGLIWISVLFCQLCVFGITPAIKNRLAYFGLFWAFLDIVWIFVFTIVYLMGVI